MFDLDIARVPGAVKLHGAELPVVAAVFIPGGGGLLDSHVVVYHNGREGERSFNVHYLVHDDDAGQSNLWQGSYDLRYADALAELNRRVAASHLI